MSKKSCPTLLKLLKTYAALEYSYHIQKEQNS